MKRNQRGLHGDVPLHIRCVCLHAKVSMQVRGQLRGGVSPFTVSSRIKRRSLGLHGGMEDAIIHLLAYFLKTIFIIFNCRTLLPNF